MSALRTDDAWQAKAACRGPQAVVFFPPSHFERKDEKLEREGRAKAICTTCPVRHAVPRVRGEDPGATRHLGWAERGRAQAAPRPPRPVAAATPGYEGDSTTGRRGPATLHVAAAPGDAAAVEDREQRHRPFPGRAQVGANVGHRQRPRVSPRACRRPPARPRRSRRARTTRRPVRRRGLGVRARAARAGSTPNSVGRRGAERRSLERRHERVTGERIGGTGLHRAAARDLDLAVAGEQVEHGAVAVVERGDVETERTGGARCARQRAARAVRSASGSTTQRPTVGSRRSPVSRSSSSTVTQPRSATTRSTDRSGRAWAARTIGSTSRTSPPPTVSERPLSRST